MRDMKWDFENTISVYEERNQLDFADVFEIQSVYEYVEVQAMVVAL